MIAEGGDGGSGRSLRGVMAEGQSGLHPLHLSTLNEEPTLEAWVRSWWDEKRGPSHHSPGRRVLFEEGSRTGNMGSLLRLPQRGRC
jgi:hypothetical protein